MRCARTSVLYSRPMRGGFIFGGLSFESEAVLSSALSAAQRTLLPALGLGACSAPTRDILQKGRRGPRAFVIDPIESLSFTDYDNLASRIWELAAASSRGRIVLGLGGEQPSLEFASRAEVDWSGDRLGQYTARWLVPTREPTMAYYASGPLEFEWTTLRSRPALDVRDWAGFFGMLVESEERIYFCAPTENDENLSFEWADLARPGTGSVIAFPGKELLVWTEVKPAGELRLPTATYSHAVEVVLQCMDTHLSVFEWAEIERTGCIPDPSVRCHSLWFAEGHGIVAVS